jgi:glutamate/tyrosine decarboxylase-like PLP-dependent enzyme
MSGMSEASSEWILGELADLRKGDLPTRGGHTLAYVYEAGVAGLDELAARAYATFATVNGLDMTAFPSVVRLENDVVRFVARLLDGDESTRGTFTSGGTESILLAVKAARDRHLAANTSPRPRMVLPVTAHAAFHKAAHYLGVEAVTLPVNPSTFRPDPEDYAGAIDERTALVVASAPSYAHGVLDPVAEIADVAREQEVPCHVDACIGGMYLPYLRRLGESVPPFDLSVPGVTSISVDLHKYGFADKGASVVLYRDSELRRHQYFAWAAWPGYPVVNPTVQGSKSAGLLAAAWAVLRRLGDDGYLELARQTRDATDAVRQAIQHGVPGLRVLGRPRASLLAVAPASEQDGVDVLHVADEMRMRGWYVQPQLSYGGLPANLHLTVTPATLPRVTELAAALEESVTAARSLPPIEVDPALAELAASLRPDELTPADIEQIFAFVGLGSDGSGGAVLPTRMAPVLALLDAMPPKLKERLLAEFVGRLFTI